MGGSSFIHALCLGIILLMSSSTSVFAMSSQNYSSSGSHNMGGGTRGSSNYSAQPDVLGQIGGSNSSSSSFSIQSGLLHSLTDTIPPVTTATPIADTYSSAQSVTLICDDFDGSGCFAIYYTTDGSAPSLLSSVYSSAIDITVATTIKYFAVDNDGNTEAIRESIYVINDTDPPVGTVVIDTGTAFTNQSSVNLTLTCNDALSGCIEMRFSNDGAAWDSAIPFNGSSGWTLNAGEGTRTVYVEFKDNAGNWSSAITDTIVLAPYKIAGIVLRTDGTPVAFALIRLKKADGSIMRLSFSDASGVFEEDYLTSGAYKLGARLIGYRFNLAFANITVADANVVITSQRSLWDGINDTQAPNIPRVLTAQAISASEILLTWDTPADNVSVSGFKVFDDGAAHTGTSVTNRFIVRGLSSSTQYCFSVSAFDGAGNESAKTSQQCATTP
jgi:hypothetical protein